MYVGSGDFWLYNIYNILLLEIEQIMLGLTQTTCQLWQNQWNMKYRSCLQYYCTDGKKVLGKIIYFLELPAGF